MAQRANNKPLLWIDTIPVYPFCGAEGEGGAVQGGGGGSQGGQGNSGQGGGGQGNSGNSVQVGQGSQGGAGGAGGNGQGAGADTVSKADYDALMARMQAADKNHAAAQQRVKELEDKDKSDLEKAQAEAQAAKDEAAKLKQNQTDMLTSNSFLTVKDSPTWHNTSAALKLLDRSLITIEDDGTVKGMEAAVKKLQTDHPYLVKPAEPGDGKQQQQGGGGQGGGGQGGGQRPSGSSNNGQGGGGKGPDRKELEKRFPALRGRARSTD